MKSINLFISLMLLVVSLNLHAEPQLNGLALELEFNKERYIAAVYSETLSADVQELLDNTLPRRLEIRVVAERLSARRLRNQWMEAIAINNLNKTLSEQADNMVAFANLLTGRLFAGDHLSMSFDPNTDSTSIVLNGTELGIIENRVFFNTLLRAWVGSIPPSTDFRNALLASGEISGTLLRSYNDLNPSADRMAQIAAMVKAKTDQLIEEPIELTSIPDEVNAQLSTTDILKVDAPKPITNTNIPAPTLAALDPNPALANVTDPASTAPTPQTPEPAQAPQAPELAMQQESPQEPEAPEELKEDEPLTAYILFARQTYHSTLLRHTFKHIRYPRASQVRSQEGSVRLSVTIDTNGQLKSVQTLQDSRHSRLNKAALEAVKRAEPYPIVPSLLGTNEHTFTIPITFQLPD